MNLFTKYQFSFNKKKLKKKKLKKLKNFFFPVISDRVLFFFNFYLVLKIFLIFV